MLPLLVIGQNSKVLSSINSDVWHPFSKAFESKDIDLFRSIHDDGLIRVAANINEIKDLDSYMEGYRTNWESQQRTQHIEFRFLERIHNDSIASERGIYKFTIHPNTDSETSYYGKFHVLLTKNGGIWKLLLDYDSNENNTINEASYLKAYAVDDFSKF